MQVMPFNARRLGLTPAQLWTPTMNILAGTRLLAVLLRHYQGDVISTLVAYNAVPRRPRAPVPQNGETPKYVGSVLSSWRALRRCEARARAG
jgi:soluble lytic murein transglycosylase-like protein